MEWTLGEIRSRTLCATNICLTQEEVGPCSNIFDGQREPVLQNSGIGWITPYLLLFVINASIFNSSGSCSLTWRYFASVCCKKQRSYYFTLGKQYKNQHADAERWTWTTDIDSFPLNHDFLSRRHTFEVTCTRWNISIGTLSQIDSLTTKLNRRRWHSRTIRAAHHQRNHAQTDGWGERTGKGWPSTSQYPPKAVWLLWSNWRHKHWRVCCIHSCT